MADSIVAASDDDDERGKEVKPPQASRGRVYTVRIDGKPGREIPVRERTPSGDPVVESLWAMKVGQVEQIARDPLDPRHEQAAAVLAEMMAPLTEAMQASWLPTTSGLQKQLADWASAQVAPLTEALRKQLPAPKLPVFDTAALMHTKELLDDLANSLALSIQAEDESPVEVDFRALEAPDVTPDVVLDAAQVAASEVFEVQASYLRELVDLGASQARREEEKRADEVKRNRILDARNIDNYKVARSGALGSWMAAGLAVVSMVVAILIASWPKP